MTVLVSRFIKTGRPSKMFFLTPGTTTTAPLDLSGSYSFHPLSSRRKSIFFFGGSGGITPPPS